MLADALTALTTALVPFHNYVLILVTVRISSKGTSRSQLYYSRACFRAAGLETRRFEVVTKE